MASNFTNNVISAIDIKNTKYNIRAIPFHATEAEWNSINYIPKQGEFIVYDADNNNTSPRFKTGDGVTDVKNLPFTLTTISEVQTYVNSQIGSAGHLKRVVLEDGAELPEVSEADVDTIYMKRNNESRLISDVFDEYMVINGAWEIIGNTRVDLSNYTTQEIVDEKIRVAIAEIPQDDWNASEGEPGHVLNRTHYTEGGRVEVLAECQPVFNSDDGGFVIESGAPDLEIGAEYTVNWNGTEYTSVALDGAALEEPGTVVLGDVYTASGGNVGTAPTGEPYVILSITGAGQLMAMSLDGATELTLSIYQDGEVVHKLNPKYLPDGVPYVIEGTGGFTEILPECQPTVDPEDGMMILTSPLNLIDGSTYKINWNGVEYQSTAIGYTEDGMTAVCLGDLYTASGGQMGTAPTGEPFVILEYPPDFAANMGFNCMILPLDGSTELTLSIYQGSGAEVRKLDGRCLPSGVPYIEGEGTIKTILTETTFTGIGSLDAPLLADYIPLTANTTYIVNWNGTEYTCVSRILSDNNGLIGIGNLSYLGGTGNNEPFGIASGYFDGSQSSLLISNDGTTEATISIKQDGTVFHKIDERLLPENIGTTYTLTKEDSTIKLVGSDGSETSVTDSNPTLWSLGVYVTGAQINSAVDAIGDLPGKKTKPGEIFNDLSTNQATGQYSHAEGSGTTASGDYGSHAEGSGTTASGDSGSHAEGYYTTASGYYSHAEGNRTTASGSSSHAEGNSSDKLPDTITSESTNEEIITAWETTKFTLAKGDNSHAEGGNTLALGGNSHAEGANTIASGYFSHAEGRSTTASGFGSHAEGENTAASGSSSHVEGERTIASGERSHAEGYYTTASGDYGSHAEGNNTTASGDSSHAEGNSSNKLPDTITEASTNEEIITAWETTKFTLAKGVSSHVEGQDTLALSYYSHAEGYNTIASGNTSHAEGYNVTASGNSSHAEGRGTTASGQSSHAEGNNTIASGNTSHAEGVNTTASGYYSHAEGERTTASGYCSHAEGLRTTASGSNGSHAEGYSTKKLPDTITEESTNEEIIAAWETTEFTLAKDIGSHAEGQNTLALGSSSHAEGERTTASGSSSHAEGYGTIASGFSSHAEGWNTTASGSYQHVQGQYNKEDTEDKYAHIVGNGDSTTRSNAHTLGWDGSAWFAGDVYVGSTSGTNKDEGSKKLVTAPTDAVAGDLLMYDGTNWVKLSKADLIAEIIAALPSAEEASF